MLSRLPHWFHSPGELARPALHNQPSIEQGNIGCGSFGQAELVGFGDDRHIAGMDWLPAPPSDTGQLPGDRAV